MSASFYSQVSNFIDSFTSDVDPRTRLFSAQQTLGTVTGNFGMGPALELTMSYSATLPIDLFGMGVGMTLTICIYIKRSGTLYLNTGECFKVRENIGSSDSYIEILQQKLCSTKIEKLSADKYSVINRNGEITTLYDIGDAIARPIRIFSPLGYSLTLNWRTFPFGLGIASIVDDANRTLVTCSYSDDDLGIRMQFYPDTSETYYLQFLTGNGHLSTIVHSNLPDGACWQFLYADAGIPGLLTLCKTVTPTGLIKEVEYNRGTNKGIMYFPDSSGLDPLPAVTSLRVSPGHAQPDIMSLYAPSEGPFTDYLGYGGTLGGAWNPDADNAYGVLEADYEYQTIVTLIGLDGSNSVTTYHYNSYHLLTRIETTQDDCIERIDTEYYATPGADFDLQPNMFQYPRSQTHYWIRGSNSRAEVSEFDYDNYGLLLREVLPSGETIDSTYYDVNGEPDSDDQLTGCPPDPTGFRRPLKSQTVTPDASLFGDEPIRRVVFRYGSLSAISGTPVTYAPVPVRQTHGEVIGDSFRVLQKIDVTYNTLSPSGPDMEFGRVSKQSVTHYDDSDTPHTLTLESSYSSGQDVWIQNDTLTSCDGLVMTTSLSRSSWSNLITAATDPLGNRYAGAYDTFQRLVKFTRSVATEYEATTVANHQLGVKSGEVTSITSTYATADGNAIRLSYDALGRALQAERNTVDAGAPDGWQIFQTCAYDAFGRTAFFSQIDYTDATDAATDIGVTTSIEYDAWGEPCVILDSTGVSMLDTYDPIACTSLEQRQTDDNALLSGAYSTEYNVFDLPETVQVMEAAGKIYSTRVNGYDSLGRLRTVTDEAAHTTTYTYDAYDRVRTQLLPDGTLITLSYTPLSSASLPTRMEVTDAESKIAKVIGEQTFDGLGRLTQAVCGGRTTSVTYDGANRVPSQVRENGGQAVSYTYVKELGNAVSTCRSSMVSQHYTYDKKSGNPLTVSEDGSRSVALEWWPSGLKKSEKFTTASGATFATSFYWTMMGKPLRYADIEGIDHNVTYDDYGRLKTMSDADVNVSLTYDAASRLSTQTLLSSRSSDVLATQLTWDDFDREVQRDIAPSRDSASTIAQTYQPNNQLKTRTLLQGMRTVRSETFTYDGRNRLTGYTCTGESPTVDGHGQALASQTFGFDALDNIVSCTTVLAYGGTDTMQNHFDNALDPTQLTSLTHTLVDQGQYPAQVGLRYDTNGRMTLDEAGYALTYDDAGRLTRAEQNGATSTYQYDGMNRLVTQNVGGNDSREFFYGGSRLINEVQTDRGRHNRLAITPLGTGAATTTSSVDPGLTPVTQLAATDSQQSTILSMSEADSIAHAYAPFGTTSASSDADSGLPGFTGERVDPFSGAIHLGLGYRSYRPGLQRFTCPDSQSPFGVGGLNPYAYCANDPGNLVDPDGHGPIFWARLAFKVARRVARRVRRRAAKRSARRAAESEAMTVPSTEPEAALSETIANATGDTSRRTSTDSAAGFDAAWDGNVQGSAGGKSVTQGVGDSAIANEASPNRTDPAGRTVFGMSWGQTPTGEPIWGESGFYTDTVGGKKQPTLMLHGNREGTHVGYHPYGDPDDPGQNGPYLRFNAEEFHNHLKSEWGLDLSGTPDSPPLHSYGCYIREGSFPGDLARVLNRPVMTFGYGGRVSGHPKGAKGLEKKGVRGMHMFPPGEDTIRLRKASGRDSILYPHPNYKPWVRYSP
ncbi:protein of unknown function [Pararobbsia alpina]|uniref:RHS repeat-associated core domain-containing protein n=1 Tax=Pararobbsia alpina TaxID=621374 RepID=UPI0039A46452